MQVMVQENVFSFKGSRRATASIMLGEMLSWTTAVGTYSSFSWELLAGETSQWDYLLITSMHCSSREHSEDLRMH